MDRDLASRLQSLAVSDAASGRSTLPLAAVLQLSTELKLSPRQIDAAAMELGVTPQRYLRNHDALTLEQQGRLLAARVALVGLGGLGGSVLEALVRAGVGSVLAADGDVFEESNLNRQALCTFENLGRSKAQAALERARLLNPAVELRVASLFLDYAGMFELCRQTDLAVDALGGLIDRPALRQAASEAGIPLVSAAVAGWTGYVAVIPPGGVGPDQFFLNAAASAEHAIGTPAPTVYLAASLQSSQTLRLLCGQESLPVQTKALFFDLADWSFETVVL